MKFSVSFFTLEFFDNIKHKQTNFELLIETGKSDKLLIGGGVKKIQLLNTHSKFTEIRPLINPIPENTIIPSTSPHPTSPPSPFWEKNKILFS